MSSRNWGIISNRNGDYLFNYEGLKLLADRYLVRGFNKEVYELPQERFMAIAMHLALVEGKNKVAYAKKFYDLMSELKMTTATRPLLMLARHFISCPAVLWQVSMTTFGPFMM